MTSTAKQTFQKSPKKRAVIYCRVSTKEQVEEGNSLVTQEKNCVEYAIKNNYEIAGTFIEQGESAKTADRTELKKLLNFCAVKKNEVNAVLAYKIDRISRNIDDYSQIRITLKRYNVEIKSTSENFEDTPAGRFMENIIANVAQFDNEVRAERSIGGMVNAVREGRYVWLAPYGYSNVRVEGKPTIAPNKFAPRILKAFQEIALNSQPLEEIRRNILKNDLKTEVGKPLSKSYFYRIIKNEIYTGWINKFGEKNRGTFEPIVSEELFAKVQKVISSKRKNRQSRLIENPDFPLRRFFKHESGRLLTGYWAQGRKKKYPYYRVHDTDVNLRKDILENTFKQWLNHFKIDVRHFEKLNSALSKYFSNDLADERVGRNKLESRITELKSIQNAIIDKNINGIIGDEICKQKLIDIEHELDEIRNVLLNLNDTKLNKTDVLKILKQVMLQPGEVWANATFQEKVKLQWFYFPEGIELKKNGSRTTKICRLFKLKEAFVTTKSPVVNHRIQKSNTPITQLFLPPAEKLDTESPEFWFEIKEELIKLDNILHSPRDLLVPQILKAA